MAHQTLKNLFEEEKVLWSRVQELWECSADRDFSTINKALHPRYLGWDNDSLVPHDRNYVIQSVTDQTFKLLEYQLHPLGLSIYEHHVGIANYRYTAKLSDRQQNIRQIKGRWTEIYLMKKKDWILIGVHGSTEPVKVLAAADIY